MNNTQKWIICLVVALVGAIIGYNVGLSSLNEFQKIFYEAMGGNLFKLIGAVGSAEAQLSGLEGDALDIATKGVEYLRGLESLLLVYTGIGAITGFGVTALFVNSKK